MQREAITHKHRLLQETKDQARLVANNLRYLKSRTAVEYLERDLERLEDVAKRLESDISLAEKSALPDVGDILSIAQRYAEDISELLLASDTVLSKEGLIGAIFDTLPTYHDLVDSINGDKVIDGITPIFSAKTRANIMR